MSTEMALRAAALGAVLLSGCEGCKSASKGGPQDGGTPAAAGSSSSTAAVLDAGASEKRRDRALVPVGEGTSDMKPFATLDGRIVVVSGSFPYEAKANGALEPLAPIPALAPLHPDDDTFVGFLEPSLEVFWVRGELGGPGPLFLDGSAGKRKTIAVRDGKLSATTALEARHVVRWRGKLLGANFEARMKMNELAWLDDKNEPVPPPVAKISTVTGLAVDADGALVVLGVGAYDAPRAAVYPATWKPGDAPAVVEGTKAPSCTLVPSFDSSVVLRCGDTFSKVSAAGFERVFPDAPASISAASIGKDGALYVTFDKRVAAARCPAPNGKCMPVEVKGAVFDGNSPPHYEPDVSDVVERKGEFEMGDRSWTTIRIELSQGSDHNPVSYAILARGEDDIWLFARSYRQGLVLHSTDDPQRARVRMPSRLDGRFVIKNASPPQAWTGHCEQVFVRLSSDDVKKSAEVEKALGSSPLAYDSAFHWWIVEGRLNENKVSGVVIVRRDVEEPLTKLERATEKLVDAFTPNPMSKPSVYCTLPVLDHVLYPIKF